MLFPLVKALLRKGYEDAGTNVVVLGDEEVEKSMLALIVLVFQWVL